MHQISDREWDEFVRSHWSTVEEGNLLAIVLLLEGK